MAKKVPDQPQGSMIGVIIGALLSISVGILLAVVNQASIPVSEVREMPDEDEINPALVYYVKGDESDGTRWEPKRDRLANGTSGEYRFNTGELNRWARSQLKPPTSEDLDSFVTIIPSPPNFLIAGESIQVSTYLEFPQVLQRRVVVQSEGSFTNTADGPRYQSDRMFIGSCPIPSIGPIHRALLTFFGGYYLESEEYTEMVGPWAQVSNVAIENGQLVLNVP